MQTKAEDRAARWLRAWDGSGTHRTGTAGDHAGAAWLAEEAKSLGGHVSTEAFVLARLDPTTACFEVDDKRIDGDPAFDAPVTGAGGIIDVSGPAGSAASIGVAELSPQAVYSGEYRALRQSAAHAAPVIVCQGAQPGLALLNAEQCRAPAGGPPLHVFGEAQERILAAAGGRLRCFDKGWRAAGRAGAKDPGAQWGDARHPSRRRELSGFGRQQSVVPSAAGPLAAQC